MNYSTTTTSASRLAAACLIVGVYESGDPGKAAADLNDATDGAIRDLIKRGDISGQLGDARLLLSLPKVRAARVVVVGLGKRDRFGVSAFRQAVAAAMTTLKGSKAQDIVNYLSLEDVHDTSAYYLARYTVETIGTALYEFSEMKSKRKNKPLPLKKIGLALKSPGERRAATQGAEHADAIVSAMNLARDLGNLPANVCTPTYLARTAQRLARDIAGLRTQVIGETQMKRLGMNALLSVTSGTVEPAKLIVIHYKGKEAAKKAPIVLVGKGITFDTGGISLKPGPGMDEMKYDMCGAAAVMATMSAIATMALPVNVIAIVPACENLPSSTATRPGDIVKSMSGQTIEILNTDAEGRLILCDALTYARRFKPAVIVDVATLTGACVIALGHHLTAIMSNDNQLADSLADAGIKADDRGWHMPLGEDFDRQLKSNFADFANVGGREGGAVTAACFLGRFTAGMSWAHLDIAGTAWRSGSKKGSTGRPVPMLTEFVLQQAGILS